MQLLPRTVISVLTASTVPSLPFFAIALLVNADPSTLQLAGVIWLIAAAHVVLLGLPTVFWLWRIGRVNTWSLLAAGFVLGFVPVTIYAWPGEPLPGHLLHWLGRFGSSGFFGILGAFSARAFWAAWCRLGPNNSFKPKPLRGSA
jgi:hypothetical protein